MILFDLFIPQISTVYLLKNVQDPMVFNSWFLQLPEPFIVVHNDDRHN